MPVIDPTHIDSILARFTGQQFTTLDIIDRFRAEFPADWNVLLTRYGRGGAGNGSRYTANSYIALRLIDRRNRDDLILSGYDRAQVEWGHAMIARWEKA